MSSNWEKWETVDEKGRRGIKRLAHYTTHTHSHGVGGGKTHTSGWYTYFVNMSSTPNT